MSWKEDLHREVVECIETLHDMEMDSEEYLKVVPKVNDMIDRLNEAEKLDIERKKLEADEQDRLSRLDIERKKLEEDEKDRLSRLDIERKKLEEDEKDRLLRSAVEQERLQSDKRDRLIKNILTCVTFVGGAAVTIWGTLYSDNFDVDKIRGNEAGRTHIRNWLGFMKNH